jgi:hypothetical protein
MVLILVSSDYSSAQVSVYINMCKYLICYNRFPRECREIYKDLNTFIRKYLKIFEYFFVFSE